MFSFFLPIAYAESVRVDNNLTLLDLVKSALNVFLLFGGIAIFAMFLYSGFLFITSQGNPEKTTQARNTLTYAVVGIILVAISYLLMQYIFNRFN